MVKVEIEDSRTGPVNITFIMVQIDHGGQVRITCHHVVELNCGNGVMIVTKPKATWIGHAGV